MLGSALHTLTKGPPQSSAVQQGAQDLGSPSWRSTLPISGMAQQLEAAVSAKSSATQLKYITVWCKVLIWGSHARTIFLNCNFVAFAAWWWLEQAGCYGTSEGSGGCDVQRLHLAAQERGVLSVPEPGTWQHHRGAPLPLPTTLFVASSQRLVFFGSSRPMGGEERGKGEAVSELGAQFKRQ